MRTAHRYKVRDYQEDWEVKAALARQAKAEITNQLSSLCELARKLFVRQKQNKSAKFDGVAVNNWLEEYARLEQQMHEEGL
jgi:hypothetical protein